MPSSHSATVTALAVAIGFQDGFGGSVFAAAVILACVVRPTPALHVSEMMIELLDASLGFMVV